MSEIKEYAPHEQRVVVEHEELSTKTLALSDFINDSEIFRNLNIPERDRLKRQYKAMCEYQDVLKERILNF